MTFKVFISGNQTELAKERFAIKEVIKDNPAFNSFFDFFLFEDIPASSIRPDLTYINEVKNSDIFIGILGNKYGNRDLMAYLQLKENLELLLNIVLTMRCLCSLRVEKMEIGMKKSKNY